MATRAQIEEAIRRADKAGDADSVRKLGAALRSMDAQPAKPGGIGDLVRSSVGGQPSAKSKSTARKLVDATVNDVAGLAQGRVSIFDMLAQGMGKLMSVPESATGALADVMGRKDIGNAFRAKARVLAHPMTIGGLIEQAIPTPNTSEGRRDRLIGNFAGGAMTGPETNLILRGTGMVPTNVPKSYVAPRKPGKIIPKAREVVEAGKKAAVRVLTSDVRPPRTFVGKSIQALGERIPITGTGPVRQAQQVERMTAVRELARDYGAADAGPAIDDVMTDLAKTRGAELTRLKAAKDGVIDGISGQVPVGRTTAAINAKIAELKAINPEKLSPVIAQLESWGRTLGGKSLRGLEENRKILGESFKSPDMAAFKKVGEDALNPIYGALREDMGAFIKGAAPDQFSKWKFANDSLAGMANELKVSTLKSVLRTGQGTPEDVSKLLFSTKPSVVRLLYKGLSPEGRGRAQAAILQRAVEKAGWLENISPDRFSGQVKTLGDQIGIFFEGDDLARVEGLNRLLLATKRAGEASAHPTTGAQATPYVLGSMMTGIFGLPGGVGATGGTGLLARAYESAPVRNMLLALGKTKPGSAGERVLIDRAARAIAAVIPKGKPGSMPGINDNVPAVTGAVASDGTDPNRNQQDQSR